MTELNLIWSIFRGSSALLTEVPRVMSPLLVLPCLSQTETSEGLKKKEQEKSYELLLVLYST